MGPGDEQSVPQGMQLQFGPNKYRYATPEEMQQTQAQGIRTAGAATSQVAGQTTAAEEAAKEPGRALAATRALDAEHQKLITEHQNKMLEIPAEGQQRLAQTRAQVAGGITEANIHAKSAENVERLRMYGDPDMTPEKATAISEPYYYGENNTPLGNKPFDNQIRGFVKAGANGKGVEITSKQSQAIKNLNRADDIYDQMAQTVKDLPESKILANGQHQIAKNIVGSDSWNRAQQMYSMQIPLLQATGVYSARAVATEMNRLNGIMGGIPGQTKEQALANIMLGKKIARDNVIDDTYGGVSDKQKVDNLLHYGQDPSSFTTNYQGHTISRYQPDKDNPGHWKVFNPSKVGYDPIDPTPATAAPAQ
jgi:hypothetical protein